MKDAFEARASRRLLRIAKKAGLTADEHDFEFKLVPDVATRILRLTVLRSGRVVFIREVEEVL